MRVAKDYYKPVDQSDGVSIHRLSQGQQSVVQGLDSPLGSPSIKQRAPGRKWLSSAIVKVWALRGYQSGPLANTSSKLDQDQKCRPVSPLKQLARMMVVVSTRIQSSWSLGWLTMLFIVSLLHLITFLPLIVGVHPLSIVLLFTIPFVSAHRLTSLFVLNESVLDDTRSHDQIIPPSSSPHRRFFCTLDHYLLTASAGRTSDF